MTALDQVPATTAHDDFTARPEYIDVVRMPGRAGVVVAIGVVVAVAGFATDLAWHGWILWGVCVLVLFAPFFAGAILGVFAYERPVRGALVALSIPLVLGLIEACDLFIARSASEA